MAILALVILTQGAALLSRLLVKTDFICPQVYFSTFDERDMLDMFRFCNIYSKRRMYL